MKLITKGCIDKNLGVPTLYVELHGKAKFGFNFLIDTGVRYNLLDPCFYEEWIMSPSKVIVLPSPPGSKPSCYCHISRQGEEKGGMQRWSEEGL